MARQTKAQRAALAAPEAAPQAPWNFPKAADFAPQNQADSAAAFFASRLIIEPEKAADDESESKESDDSADDIAAQQKAADDAANELALDDAIDAAIAAAQNAAPERAAKRPYIARSSIVRPTKAAWAIYDTIYDAAQQSGKPLPTRGELIAIAIARGIASGTSATQYQHWKKSRGI